jgi:ABC-three component (ABC-3C) system Middle Component 2
VAQKITRNNRPISPYNTALESGLRALFVLEANKDHSYDLQRLCYYDYLLVHSGDFEGGPKSLHPAIPLRTGEFIVRRRLIEHGLTLYLSRGLVDRQLTPRGIEYSSSALTQAFLAHFETDYTKRLRETAIWIVFTFTRFTDKELHEYFRKHIDQWGNEFISVASLEEEWIA